MTTLLHLGESTLKQKKCLHWCSLGIEKVSTVKHLSQKWYGVWYLIKIEQKLKKFLCWLFYIYDILCFCFSIFRLLVKKNMTLMRQFAFIAMCASHFGSRFSTECTADCSLHSRRAHFFHLWSWKSWAWGTHGQSMLRKHSSLEQAFKRKPRLAVPQAHQRWSKVGKARNSDFIKWTLHNVEHCWQH